MKKMISIISVLLTASGLMWFLWQGIAVGKQSSFQQAEKMFPEFEEIDLRTGKNVTKESLLGKVRIVHVWASWCGPCLDEHPLWMKMNQAFPNTVIGILYRDKGDKAKAILQSQGDPYTFLVDDSKGNFGLKLALRGTPETFLIDKKGVIRYHHTGAFARATFEQDFLPLFKKLSEE